MSLAEVEIIEWCRPLTEVRNGISEEEIEWQLAAEGLIRRPSMPQQPVGIFTRINVGGKPVSESIIEERR